MSYEMSEGCAANSVRHSCYCAEQHSPIPVETCGRRMLECCVISNARLLVACIPVCNSTRKQANTSVAFPMAIVITFYSYAIAHYLCIVKSQ